MSRTAVHLSARCRWVEQGDGAAVVSQRRTVLEWLSAATLFSAVAVLPAVAIGLAWDGGLRGYAWSLAAFGTLAALSANFALDRHELHVNDGAVAHRQRWLVGATRRSAVTGLSVRHHPEDVYYGAVSGEHWTLTADRADGRRPVGMWQGSVLELQELGERLHDLTGLPFVREPAEA
jgi:hypothetical protein